jgi:DNA-binding response OmpR family regulator
MNELIAIVDDEPDILDLVALHLQKAGFRVQGFLDAKSFLGFLENQHPDAVLLDLMLPDVDGLEICRFMKKNETFSRIPVIMVTARSEETDKIIGLELGADDYVSKPFSAKELVARVKAVLRRQSPFEVTQKIDIGGILTIDPEKYEVRVEGKLIDLTSTEFRIIRLLASKKGWVFTRHQILDYLWGHEKAVLDRTVDVHIRNLRDKLGDAGRLIKNIRSVGYKLEP